MSTTHFWLIRHGETQWNAGRRLQGWHDIELNETGLQQADQLKTHLSSPSFTARMDVIVSSDLKRARQTAVQAAGHFDLPIITTPALRERNFGIYEGRTLSIVQGQRAGLAEFDLRSPNAPVPDGETLTEFAQRIHGAFEQLAADHSGRNVMVFAHGGVIDIVWRRAQQLQLDIFRAEPIINASINQFSIHADQRWTLTDWGQTDHLSAPALDEITK